MDIGASAFACNEDTFEGQNDICGDQGEALMKGCACVVPAPIQLQPTQSNSSQNSDLGATGFLLIYQMVTKWPERT